MRAQELYYCDPAMAKPILHNTVIQFNIDYTEESQFEMNLPATSFDKEFCGPKLEIQGSVVNPLKVSLLPQQYSQVGKFNISYFSNISYIFKNDNVSK